MTTITLFGILILVACAVRRGLNRNEPGWLEHVKRWQRVWGLPAFILAVLLMMNPELLALGLLGDAAFFDALVLALSLQLRSVAFRMWHCLRITYPTAWSFVICGVRRDFSTMAFALIPLVAAFLAIHQAVLKSLRQHEGTLA